MITECHTNEGYDSTSYFRSLQIRVLFRCINEEMLPNVAWWRCGSTLDSRADGPGFESYSEHIMSYDVNLCEQGIYTRLL